MHDYTLTSSLMLWMIHLQSLMYTALLFPPIDATVSKVLTVCQRCSPSLLHTPLSVRELQSMVITVSLAQLPKAGVQMGTRPTIPFFLRSACVSLSASRHPQICYLQQSNCPKVSHSHIMSEKWLASEETKGLMWLMSLENKLWASFRISFSPASLLRNFHAETIERLEHTAGPILVYQSRNT